MEVDTSPARQVATVPPVATWRRGDESAAPLWTAGLPEISSAAELPSRCDVAIIGGGYAGLSAARALGRAGAQVVVLERDRFGGAGASSRNGGFVLPGFKAELSDLIRRRGLVRAQELYAESVAAVDFVERLVREEEITCDWTRAGHVTLAARPAHLRGLGEAQELLAREFGAETRLIDQRDLGSEIGSRRYAGGLLDPAAGSLQPARYLHGLAGAAERAGAVLAAGAGVSRARRSGTLFRLETSRGPLEAGDVLVATNGLTGGLDRWLARRIVPVGSYLLATAPLEPALARRLIPRGRVMSDTKNLLYYFRLSPDGRMVFGGRAAFSPRPLALNLADLRRGMLEVFPELAAVPVEYGWGGTLGFTLDHMPHAGRHDGMGYALGFGGHGVALASWLGDRVARAMTGRAPWPGIAEGRFPAVPFYRGDPWFLPLAGAYYRWRDWWG